MASSLPVCLASSSHLVLSIEEELAKDPKNTVPERYVRVGQNPPILETPIPIPTIDMKQLVSLETKDLEKMKLHECCKEWGLFQLVNHGVSSSLLEKLNDEIEGFFKLPLEEKMKYKIRPGDVQGYGTVVRSDNQRLDWGDRMYMIINPLHRRKPYLFPELPSSLRETLEAYLLESQRLAMQLFGYLGELLEMEMGEMEELFEDGMQSVRMTYYPPCPQPELVVGLTPHSDAAGITILHQANGVEGFQIKKDGVWIPVNFLPNAFVVNMGDILEILSNGLYNSIEHRANVNPEKERISIAMFFNPKFEAEFGPASSMLNPNNPPLFRRVGMEKYVKDFFSRSLNGRTYLDYMRIKNGEANSAN
ncbi:protein SRG1-like [Quercus lobata]|uniref:Fe2OG dioxygenase domain-containing protein n=1 Tax=Quercus lobata TaxID=97700 RepID=A0A7N2LS82_QUELO|nr:protein SRG1-like [Quercus lobata]